MCCIHWHLSWQVQPSSTSTDWFLKKFTDKREVRWYHRCTPSIPYCTLFRAFKIYRFNHLFCCNLAVEMLVRGCCAFCLYPNYLHCDLLLVSPLLNILAQQYTQFMSTLVPGAGIVAKRASWSSSKFIDSSTGFLKDQRYKPWNTCSESWITKQDWCKFGWKVPHKQVRISNNHFQLHYTKV
jgi:hypothetical protein